MDLWNNKRDENAPPKEEEGCEVVPVPLVREARHGPTHAIRKAQVPGAAHGGLSS